MLGPVVDVELVDPPDKVPPGVVFGIKHLLTVPNSPTTLQMLLCSASDSIESSFGISNSNFFDMSQVPPRLS